ncbi:MAG: glycosyltransferase [Phycisphaerales bacterium]|nr:glycosyltransferase [Phycisphaerales bacterium]
MTKRIGGSERGANPPSAVLTHHWLVRRRGGEKVLEALARLVPGAPIYTLVYDAAGMGMTAAPGAPGTEIAGSPPAAADDPLAGREIHTSFLQRIPGARRHYPKLLPLMALAARRMRLPPAELVLCSDAAVAKAMTPDPRSRVICYCHSPPRYAYDAVICAEYRAALPWAARPLWDWSIPRLARADRAAAQRVDLFVANSRHVAERIRRWYGRDSVVVHPPVELPLPPPGILDGALEQSGRMFEQGAREVEQSGRMFAREGGEFGQGGGSVNQAGASAYQPGRSVNQTGASAYQPGRSANQPSESTHQPGRSVNQAGASADVPAAGTARGEHYLCVGYHAPYKRLDLAIEACVRLGRRLVVIGEGPGVPPPPRRPEWAARGVEFRGWQSDAAIRAAYAGARALLFCGEEDFGIVPVEAIAHGCPVVACGVGGATETVQPGVSGVWFERQEVTSVVAAMEQLESMRFDARRMFEAAQAFSLDRFLESMRRVIDG